MITVRLPSGEEVDVPTDDPRVAAQAGQRYFRDKDPEGFAAWQRTLPLAGPSEAAVDSARSTAGGAVGGIGTVMGQLGLPGAQTMRGAGEAIQPQERLDRRNLTGLSDAWESFKEQPLATLGNLGGMAAGSIAAIAPAALAGMAAAPLVGAGAATGAVVGAGLAGAFGSANETEQLLINEGVSPERAQLLAATLGLGVGAIEAAPMGALLARALGREVRQETVQRLVEIAGRRAGVSAARGAGAGALLAAAGEFAGEAGREGIAAAETGNLNLAERIDRAALEALTGGIAGAGLGGYAGYRDPARAQAAIDARPQFGPTERPADLPDPEVEPPLPPQPTPFETPEEAEAFIREVPEARPPGNVTDPAERTAWANAIRQQTWEQEVEITRNQELANFLGLSAIRDVRDVGIDRQGQAEVLLPNLARAAATGDIDLNSFTVQDVASLALAPLQVDKPVGPELGRTRRELNALVQDGFLISPARNTYRISPRYLSETTAQRLERRRDEARMQSGSPALRMPTPESEALAAQYPGLSELATQAPPTAQQTAASEVLRVLDSGTLQLATPDEQQAFLNSVRRQDPTAAQTAARVIELQREAADLQNAPINRETDIAEREAQLNELARERADLMDVLRGQQELRTVAFKGPLPPEVRALERTEGGFPGDLTPDNAVQIVRAATAKHAEAVAAKTAAEQQAKDAELRASLESEPVVELMRGLAMLSNPRAQFSPAMWQQLFKANGNIQLTPEQAQIVHRVARERGILDKMNQAVRPANQQTAPVVPPPPSPPPAPKPRAKKATTKSAPTQPAAQVVPPPPPLPATQTAQQEAAPNTNALRSAFRERLGNIALENSGPPKKSGRRNPKSSVSGPAPATMTVVQVRGIVRDVTKGWKNAPTIKVVWFEEDVPSRQPDDPPFKGVYDVATGQIYLVASRLSSREDVRATIYHEALAHYGLRQQFQNALGAMLRDIYATNAELRNEADKFRDENFSGPPDPADNVMALEEVLARRLESGQQLPVSIFNRLLNFVKRWARSMGLWAGDYSAAEVAGIMNAARDKVINGTAAPILETPFGTSLFSTALPSNTAAAQATLNKATRDSLSWTMRWLGSPIMTISKMVPAFRQVGATQQKIQLLKQTFSSDVMNRLDSLAKLAPAEAAELARILVAASEARKPADLSKLTPAQQAAGKGAIEAGQRSFDYLINAFAYENFNPDAAKTPADRARLERFWQKQGDKLLTEVPAAELRAASPEGAALIERLNKLRNPAYIPALAQGTHFVAVYKRNARGENDGPPVKMVAFTPLNAFQKLRGYADLEAAAIQQLQSLYPDARRYNVMQQGVEFTRDNDAAKIRNQGDAIAAYLQRLQEMPNIRNNAQAQRELGSLLDGLDKAQMERVFRPNQGILIPLTPTNETSYLLDTLPSYYMGVANIVARRQTQGDFTRATAPLSPADKAFATDLRDYSTSATEAFSSLRTFTFFSLLGGAIDSALLNGLQIFQTTAPMLIRDGGPKSMAHFSSAFRDVLTKLPNSFQDSGKFAQAVAAVAKSPAEKAALERAIKLDIFMPLYTTESRGQVTVDAMRKAGFKDPHKRASNINTLARMLGIFQQSAEQLNRAVTFLAAYRTAVADPNVIARANKYDNTQISGPDAAFQYALAKVADTQYTTTKEDRALLQRFTPAAELATQFMSYPLKTFENYVRHASIVLRGMKDSDPDLMRAGIIGVLGQAAPLIALAGIWALPGADFLRELLEGLIKLGWESPQNFDADMRRMMGGGFWGEALVRGLPQAGGMAAISDRLKVDPVNFQDLAGMQVTSLMGPTGNLIEGPIRAYQFFKEGDYINGLAALPIIPRALGNVIRGADQAVTGEIRTPRGTTLVASDQMAAINKQHLIPVWLRTAVGFQSPDIVALRDTVTRNREVQQNMNEATARFNKRAADEIVAMLKARQVGNADGVAEAMRNFNRIVQEQVRRNNTAIEAGDLTKVINFSMPTIQRRAMDDFLGRSSEQVLMRSGNRNARGDLAEERSLYNWRNQPN